jgi:hypothetical protein
MPEPAPLCLLTFFFPSLYLQMCDGWLKGSLTGRTDRHALINAELERACAQKLL